MILLSMRLSQRFHLFHLGDELLLRQGAAALCSLLAQLDGDFMPHRFPRDARRLGVVGGDTAAAPGRRERHAAREAVGGVLRNDSVDLGGAAQRESQREHFFHGVVVGHAAPRAAERDDVLDAVVNVVRCAFGVAAGGNGERWHLGVLPATR